MKDIHFEILKFLDNEGSAIAHDKFPKRISSEFKPYTLTDGSLYHELDLILDFQKGWIEKHNSKFVITPFGKEIFQEELLKREGRNEKEKLHEEKFNLELQSLKLTVEDLVTKIAGYDTKQSDIKEGKLIQWIAIVISAAALIVAFFKD